MRIDLGPSRMLAAALALLGVLAAVSVLMSDLAAPWSVPGAMGALGFGAHCARTEARGSRVVLHLRGDGAVDVDGEHVSGLSAAFHGPLTCLQWTQAGRIHRRVAWPDILDARGRRELRLWALLHRPTGRAPAVAG